MKKASFFLAFVIISLSFSKVAKSQLTVTPSQTAASLAQMLVGTGVQISNATLVCPPNANGIFTAIAPAFGLDSGIILTSGQANTVGATWGANAAYTQFATTSNNAGGDPDLTALANQTTNDVCKLEFDFVPAGDTIKFDYVFASEEYNGPHGNFNCSINDVFGFFISGPGIVGNENIALIPNTPYAVGVSTVNDGVGASIGNSCYTNTGGNGPYTQYYNNNVGNNNLVYTGFTDVFTAVRAVTPCTTYHLKLAIADASDHVWDSGVFLKAGSLTSNAITVTPIGGGGLAAPQPYTVRGCLPGQFVFNRPFPYPTPLTIKFQIQGSATNGTDYNQIADSVVIPGGQTSTILNIYGIPVNPPTGPENVKLRIFSPYSCTTPVVIDSAEIWIYDSLDVEILSADTAVCKHESVQIFTRGDTLLEFTWYPSAGLDSVNGRNPTATPLSTTTYTVAATLPGSGCPPSHDHITISIQEEPDVDAGPDIVTCLGVQLQLDVNVTPTTQNYTYSWSPGTNLSATNISNPVSTPTGDITYYIEVDPGAAGCLGYDTLNIRVLPDDFSLFNSDTAICRGASVQINAIGDTNFTYTWDPPIWINDPGVISPVITPDTSQLYTLTASFPGCPNIVKQLYFDVQPVPNVYVGPDREKCQWDTVMIQPIITPAGYPNYTYTWVPAGGLDDPSSKNVTFSGQASVSPLSLSVATPAGCIGTDDLDITVRQGNFASLVPEDAEICPRETVTINATGGVFYYWSPRYYLSDTMTASVVASPVTNTTYSVLVTDQYGCLDTLESRIIVHPAAVVELGNTVTLYPGESVQMDPEGNGLYFSWFPPHGLSATNIANPVAMPDVRTRYFVEATTEHGCTAMDSIDVLVETETLLDLPNAFSPGSQPNEELKIIKRGLATLKYFRIFNRWGAKVFETSDIEEGWDGRLNGTPQPMGVYVYMIEAETSTGRRFVKQGNVTLIR